MADLIPMLAAVAGQAGEEADEDFNQTVLLLHGDGTNGAQNNTFLDGSTNNFTITRNGNTTQGTFSPFSLAAGEFSNYFDGTDDYLSVADNAVLRPGAGAFTLEAWIYRNASGAAHTIYAKGGASTGIVFQVTSGNVLRFTHTTTNIDSTGTIAANTWTHVAVVREGTGSNQTKLYINGTNDGQGTVSTDFTQTEEVRIGTNRGATDDFAGYISNVRFVKGSALYTTTFTPSTSPLTTTSQGASSSEVELLTCQSNRFVDNSTNAFAITRNGDVKVTPFSPFAPTAAYSASTNGGSGYFDGTGDYLSIADNASLDMGSGNFTIEFWFYPVVTPNHTPFSKRVGVNDFAGILINFSSSTTPVLLATTNGSSWNVSITSSINVSIGAWNHIAVTRSSDTWTLWVNGSSGGTATVSGTVPDNAGPFVIGGNAQTPGNVISNSHLFSFRVVKGTAVYTAAFTPPTAPLTAITNTSLLCNFTNAGIFDQTGKNNLETVGDAQIDTGTKKYGTGSIELDGNDFLVARDDDNLEFGSGDFTIEAWINLNALPATNGSAAIVSKWNTSNLSYLAGVWNDAGTVKIAFFYTTNGSSTSTISAAQTFSTGVWYHVAYVRNGSSFRLFVDGTEKTAGATISGTLFNGTAPFNVGRTADGSNFLNGYIDDLRITKGVARYTANFTAPTKAFPDQ
jgi:hypothetical protein